ncbi:unnamed protein product [Symbiodinium microadriaticum]|nr:unnamed protein product [Symbiodinium microadriaticum]CAE7947298.1 unnamed protein product [Symbiodinium sp. KB8]
MQVLFAHRRAISEGCCRQRVFTCFCCASSSFVHATRARRASQQLRYATSRFNGVYWNKKLQKFRAGVKFEGVQHYAGYFTNEAEAAYSFDAKLREVCRDPLRLKKSLNFPTEQEQCYEESLLETRSRGLRLSSQNLTKEVESHQRLLDRFSKSPQASEFEILNVPSLSRVDSLFRPLGSKLGGLALQLKSTSLKKRSSRSSSEHYAFQHTSGYGGTLLVLIALDRDMIWMVPGSEVSQTGLCITLGSQRDQAWRVSQVGPTLTEYFQNASIPHISFQDALLQCNSRNHRVEEHSHTQLVSVFASMGLPLHRPVSLRAAVDSVLSSECRQWHIQEKAVHRSRAGRYVACLSKHGGCFGRVPYTTADFDILLVSLLDKSDRLVGLFVFPSFDLAEHKLLGQRTAIPLYPPWSPPKFPAIARKHGWKLDYFVDLRSWKGKDSHLDPATKTKLAELLKKLQAAHFGLRAAEPELCSGVFPILRTRSAAAATRLSAAGLAMLSLPWAAVAFKTEPGLWVGTCYHVGAVASALVKVPILHSLLLAGPCWAGWRACAAFFGALLGPSLAGPLSSWTDEDSLMALLVIVGGVTCAAQLCAAETLHGPVESEDPGADLSSEESGHLLAGSAVATLLLSVQGALVPLLIRSSSMAAGGLEVVSVILTGAGLFLAAWLARRLAPRGVVLSLFLASAMAALALRGVLRSLGVARSHELTFARLALQTALGGLLGLGVALPTRLRYAAAPATADALRSCGLAAAAFFGECLGLTLQLLLLPVLGAELTLSAMAMAPLIYSFAMILRLPKAGRSKIGEDGLSDTLDLSEGREVTKYVRGANSGRTNSESS